MKISQYANNNVIMLPSKPGIVCFNERIHFFSFEQYPDFYPGAQFGANPLYLPPVLSAQLNIKSNKALFLLLLRYCSLMLPLAGCGWNIYFPYLLVVSEEPSHTYFFNPISTYLKVMNRNDSQISSINQPFRQLEQTSLSRNNNALIINAIQDATHIRNENINFLLDYYVSNQADHICVLLSDTVQEKLCTRDYISLDLHNCNFPNLKNLHDTLMRMDCSILYSLLHLENFSYFYNEWNKEYFHHFSKATKHLSDQNAIMTYATLLTMKYFIMTRFSIPFLSDPKQNESFDTYILSLFQEQQSDDTDSSLCVMFQKELNQQIKFGNLILLENDKGNHSLSFPIHASAIYLEQQLILIPKQTFDLLCQSVCHGKQSNSIRKALYEGRMMHYEAGLYVSKKMIYPPGSNARRCDVYILSQSLIDDSLLQSAQWKHLLQLSDFKRCQSDPKNIIIGYDQTQSPIVWSYSHDCMANRHLFVTGRSGCGKTTLLKRLIKQLADRGETVLIFDGSISYTALSDNPDCSTLPVNPFLHCSDSKQKSLLYENLINTFGLKGKAQLALREYLDDPNKISEEMKKYLTEVLTLAHNCEGSTETWGKLLEKPGITVLPIHQFSTSKEKLTDFLLRDLYNYQMQSREHSVFVVVDEIQNMVCATASSIIQLMSQGRENKIALLSATQSFQSIPPRYKSMFLQASLCVFFQPEVTAAEFIAKLIHNTVPISRVTNVLKRLKQGEYLLYGSFETELHSLESDKLIYGTSMQLQAPLKDQPQGELSTPQQEKSDAPEDLNVDFIQNTFGIIKV